jgi:hypothetical protein
MATTMHPGAISYRIVGGASATSIVTIRPFGNRYSVGRVGALVMGASMYLIHAAFVKRGPE